MGKKYYDGKKMDFGFEFQNMKSVVKTVPDFTRKKELSTTDVYALRWVAMHIIDQIDKYWNPEINTDWKKVDDSNFVVDNTLCLNNGYGIYLPGGYIMHHLQMAPGGQYTAWITEEENEEKDFTILIS